MPKLNAIEGIGEFLEGKLNAAGIGSIRQLLEVCADKKGRKRIAIESGVDEGRLLRFVNHADLMRVKGVGGQFSELLEAAGVDSVPELAQRKPVNLAAVMRVVNAEKRLVRRVPSIKEVAVWVEQAKTLDRVVTH